MKFSVAALLVAQTAAFAPAKFGVSQSSALKATATSDVVSESIFPPRTLMRNLRTQNALQVNPRSVCASD